VLDFLDPVQAERDLVSLLEGIVHLDRKRLMAVHAKADRKPLRKGCLVGRRRTSDRHNPLLREAKRKIFSEPNILLLMQVLSDPLHVFDLPLGDDLVQLSNGGALSSFAHSAYSLNMS
jgi:hypothetical protein